MATLVVIKIPVPHNHTKSSMKSGACWSQRCTLQITCNIQLCSEITCTAQLLSPLKRSETKINASFRQTKLRIFVLWIIRLVRKDKPNTKQRIWADLGKNLKRGKHQLITPSGQRNLINGTPLRKVVSLFEQERNRWFNVRRYVQIVRLDWKL